MSDLKFKCSTCGQPILVDSKDSGRKLACPSCRTQLTVPKLKPEVPSKKKTTRALRIPADPAPTASEKKSSLQQTPAPPKPRSGADRKASGDESTVAPVKQAPRVAPTLPSIESAPAARKTEQVPVVPAAPATASPPTPVAKPAPAPDPAESGPQPVQVGVLTSELKLEAVQGARARLADPGHWMPGRGQEGRLAYAAIQGADGLRSIDVGSEEAAQATHFSLMGAILSEIHRLKLTPTANGRVEFLDTQIPEALWAAVQGDSRSDPGKAPDSTDPRLMNATHGQCLAALDLLERKFAEEVRSGAGSGSGKQSHGSTLEDLMLRATRDEVVTTHELLRSVHHELIEIHRRLDDLEKASTADPAP
ncbi:MAG: hypothetical protein AB7O66_06305 [Limisphaerales bacterium]